MRAIIRWIIRNVAAILGVIDAILELAVRIVPLTPSKVDDAILAKIKPAFAKLKDFLLKAGSSD